MSTNSLARLQAIMQARDEVSSSNAASSWRWNGDLLFNPQIRCPWCQTPVQSNRVWLIKRESSGYERVLGAWLLSGAKLRVGHSHPHIYSDGKICIGNAGSPVEALTVGINPGDIVPSGIRPAEWFPRMGHQCAGMLTGRSPSASERTFTPTRIRTQAAAPSSPPPTCPICSSSLTQADLTRSRVYYDHAWRSVCASCFSDSSLLAECESCDGVYQLSYLTDDGLCTDCNSADPDQDDDDDDGSPF